VVIQLLNNQSGTITKTMQQSRKRLLVKAFALANDGMEIDIGHTKKSGYFCKALAIPVLTDKQKATKALENAMASAMDKLSKDDIRLIVDIALKGIDGMI
jgi:RNA binding exosome subunit